MTATSHGKKKGDGEGIARNEIIRQTETNRGKQFPGDTALLILACCLEIVSLRSGWPLTQPSQCIMGDQREASTGHRAGAASPGEGVG